MTIALPDSFPFTPPYIFSDVDDTLTHNGRLHVETLEALEKLQQAGIKVIPVTGACGGWCDCIVRTWPVDTVIGENGAFIMELSGAVLNYTFMQDEETRRQNRITLQKTCQEIDKTVDNAVYAGDNHFRLTDFAYDIGQQTTLAPAEAARIFAICEKNGVNAKASSIHINLWAGDYNKALTASHYLTIHGIDPAQTLFVGDSLNDEAMFSAWETSVGVANISPFLPRLPKPPTFITKSPGGLGFAELAQSIFNR